MVGTAVTPTLAGNQNVLGIAAGTGVEVAFFQTCPSRPNIISPISARTALL